MILLLSACASISDENHGGAKLFLGLTHVKNPNTVGDIYAVDYRSLGAGWDEGPWLGWRAGNWVVADPAKCQLLIIVRAPAETQNAIEIVQALKGSEPCIVDFTRGSQP